MRAPSHGSVWGLTSFDPSHPDQVLKGLRDNFVECVLPVDVEAVVREWREMNRGQVSEPGGNPVIRRTGFRTDRRQGMDEASNLTSVYRTTDPAEAEILRAEIEASGVACRIGSELQGGLTGVLYEIRLLVRAEDADQAKEIIEELIRSKHDHGELEDPDV